jgi:oxygen-dependent protoporphyrinogen oxidase
MKKVAVIGGGISGIAAAHYLKKGGFSVDLYESGSRIGGRIGSEQMQGRWLDFGGKNIGRKYRRFREFVGQTGDFPFEYFGFNTSQVVGGKVVRLTKEGKKLANLYGFARLAGIQGIATLYPWVRAVMKDKGQGMLNTPFFNDVSMRLDHAPLSSCCPGRCAANLVRPVTVRMNGAEPDECYPGNFGSNLALVLDSYEQLEGGMHQLLDAFAAGCAPQVTIRTEHRVEQLSSRGVSGGTEVVFSNNGIRGSACYERVVAALPAVQLAPLLSHAYSDISRLLERVTYYPVSVAVVSYRENVFRKEQRAMVFDQASSLSNAGAYGIHDLNLVRYTFSGRTARRQIHAESAAEDVILQAEEQVFPYFSLADNQRLAMTYKYLSPGLCAYSPFHHRLLSELQEKLAAFPGLYVTGDYCRGASIEACFTAAGETVNQLVQGASF